MPVSAVASQDRVSTQAATRPRDAQVSFRSVRDGSEVTRSLSEVALDDLEAARPWRTFRWRKGQRHYSGTYWCATERDHVIYESRLELARLMLADFDANVTRIVAQPFLLRATVDGQHRRHVPDYLLVGGGVPVIVDVKPWRRLSNPTVESTFAWTAAVLQTRGWRREVATEPAGPEFANVAFLAGYRRSWLIDPELISDLAKRDLDGRTFGEAVRAIAHRQPAAVRAALLHLLWRQVYTVDLARPLSETHVLERAA